MEITVLKVRDLNEAWWRCIREVLTKGYEYTIDSGSYVGQKRKELDFIVCQITNPNTRPLVPLVPDGVPAPTTIEYVEKDYLPYLMSSIKGDNLIYSYGDDIEKQFTEICNIYTREGYNTNRCTMRIGNSSSLLLEHQQCLLTIDSRVRYGKLHYVVQFRSWDLFSAFSANLAGIQLMKEAMADEIGVEDGEIIAISKGLHLYSHSWELAKQVVGL